MRWCPKWTRWCRWRRAAPIRRVDAWRGDAARLAQERFDLAVLLPNSFMSAWTAARAGIPERWGYAAQGRGPWLTRRVRRPPGLPHQADYYLTLISALGLPPVPRIAPIAVPADRRAAAAALLATAVRGVVVMAPGAAYGRAKQWPPERFAELAADPVSRSRAGHGHRRRRRRRRGQRRAARRAGDAAGRAGGARGADRSRRPHRPGDAGRRCSNARTPSSPTTPVRCTWPARSGRRSWPSSAPPTSTTLRRCPRASTARRPGSPPIRCGAGRVCSGSARWGTPACAASPRPRLPPSFHDQQSVASAGPGVRPRRPPRGVPRSRRNDERGRRLPVGAVAPHAVSVGDRRGAALQPRRLRGGGGDQPGRHRPPHDPAGVRRRAARGDRRTAGPRRRPRGRLVSLPASPGGAHRRAASGLPVPQARARHGARRRARPRPRSRPARG